MLQGWNVFKQFCDVPVERNLEGAQFEFKQAKFELPHGRFYFGFRRYWYKPGRVSDTAYLATIDCRFAFHPELTRLSVQLERTSEAQDPRDDLATLRSFIEEVEMLKELWATLQTLKPEEVHYYGGPQ